LDEKLDTFERKRGIEILRVYVNEHFYYTAENKQFMEKIIETVLYEIYRKDGRKIKTLNFTREGVIISDREGDIASLWPFKELDSIEIPKLGIA